MKDEQAKPLRPEELVAMYSNTIYRIAYSRLQNVQDAEDITQEVLLKYIRADKTFLDEDHRRMWIIRVTVNAVHSLCRSAWRRHTAFLEEVKSLPAVAQESLGIREALKELPEKYRIPLHLFYFVSTSAEGIISIRSQGAVLPVWAAAAAGWGGSPSSLSNPTEP